MDTAHTAGHIHQLQLMFAGLEDKKTEILLVGVSWVKFSWQAKPLCSQEVSQLRLLKFLCRGMFSEMISLSGILSPHMVVLLCLYHRLSASLILGDYQLSVAK